MGDKDDEAPEKSTPLESMLADGALIDQKIEIIRGVSADGNFTVWSTNQDADPVTTLGLLFKVALDSYMASMLDDECCECEDEEEPEGGCECPCHEDEEE